MPWTDDDGPVPAGSEDQLLARVEERAERIRGRRRQVQLTGAAAAMVALLGMFALTRASGDPGTELQVAGQPSTTSPSGPTATTVSPPFPSTSLAPGPPSVPFPTTTTRPTAPATTTRPPVATTVPVTEPETTTTTVFVPAPLCTSAEMAVSVVTDKSTYAAGETVQITASAENRSDRVCRPADPALEIRNSAGVAVYEIMVVDKYTMPSPDGPAPGWAPGQVVTDPYTWDQRTCIEAPCTRVSGTYTITISYGPYQGTPATITLA